MMLILGMLKNKIARNAFWIIGGKAIHMLFAFIVGILTARYLGPGNYGLINYAAAYTTFFFSLCTLGINSVIVKEMVDSPEEEGAALGTTICLRGISSVLSAFMILGIVLIVDGDEKTTLAVTALSSLGLIFQVFDTFNYWFQAHLKSKYSAIASTIAYIVVSVYKLFLLMKGAAVEWFALAAAIDHIVVALLLFLSYKRLKGPKLSFSLKKAKMLLRSSRHFILAGIMVSVYGSVDKLMLKQMLNESAVGHYATAVSVCNMWVFVLTAIIDSMYPVIMKNNNENVLEFERSNKVLYAIVFYIAMFVSAVICVIGEPLIQIMYGEAYLPAAAPMRVITWYVAFSYLGVARNAWMVSKNKQKYLVFLYVGAAVTNVILNAALIPYWGAVGAAAASLVTQFSTIFVFPVLIKDLRPNAKLMLDAILLKGIRR